MSLRRKPSGSYLHDTLAPHFAGIYEPCICQRGKLLSWTRCQNLRRAGSSFHDQVHYHNNFKLLIPSVSLFSPIKIENLFQPGDHLYLIHFRKSTHGCNICLLRSPVSNVFITCCACYTISDSDITPFPVYVYASASGKLQRKRICEHKRDKIILSRTLLAFNLESELSRESRVSLNIPYSSRVLCSSAIYVYFLSPPSLYQ